MKKRINYILVCMIFLAGGCATIYKTDSTQLKIIQASDIISEPEKYHKIVGQYFSENKELVIFFNKGQAVPFRISMLLSVAKLETRPNNLLFLHDTYLLISPSKMRVSPDGQRWADIYDIESQKKLFGFDKGKVSVGFQITRQEGPVISLDVTTK